jgi:hypothetical protein
MKHCKVCDEPLIGRHCAARFCFECQRGKVKKAINTRERSAIHPYERRTGLRFTGAWQALLDWNNNPPLDFYETPYGRVGGKVGVRREK